MTKKYIILTDSCADLPPTLISDLNIGVLPLKFTINNKEYHNYPDGREMTSKDFYDLLRNKEVSTTTQATPNEFINFFKPYLEEGYDILYIAFSSALSGTYNSSTIAKRILEEEYKGTSIICIDSLCASMGQGLLVYYAVMQQKSGKSLEEICEYVENKKLHIVHWFTVDDLGTLKRGGRVSSTAAALGTLLGIKPILHVSDEGKLVPVMKVRGRKKALQVLVDKVGETLTKNENEVIFISHGDCLEDAKEVGEMMKEKYQIKQIIYNDIGPVIGSHSGPGTLAIFNVASSRKAK